MNRNDDGPVTLSIADGVAWLELAQPQQRNAIGPALARALAEKAEICATSPQVRCVVLTGRGDFFCVGGDIDLFAQAGADAQAQVLDLAHGFHRAVACLAAMRKPLITAVNGPAAGAGLSLAILGDIAITAASAHFTAAYSAVGLTPDGGLTWTLPRLIGMRRAQDMILSNRRVDAQEAVSIGLVTRCVADDELLDAARWQASRFAAGPVGALGQCRALLLAGQDATLTEQLDAEAASIAAACAGAEGREGVAAFLSKRPPEFIGRESIPAA